MSRRLTFAIAIEIFGGVLCWAYNLDPERDLVALGWPFDAAHYLLAGRDPYRHELHANLIPYPLSAALVVLPAASLN